MTNRAIERARHAIVSASRKPVFRLGVIGRLALVGAVTAAPSLAAAAVSPAQTFTIWPSAVATASMAPAPVARAPIDNSPGVLGLPAIAERAYRNAERLTAQTTPGCGLSWNLLAGIGRIESRHAFDGATDIHGTAVEPIFGPALDGSLPGNEIIVDGRGADGQIRYARAMGPMQFLPTTWAIYAADGNGNGRSDPQNFFDAALAAARYLCSGDLDLRDRSQLVRAVLRYNYSMAYTKNVLAWAEAYLTGVEPVNLPAITAPPRPPVYTQTIAQPAEAAADDSSESKPRRSQSRTGSPSTAAVTGGGGSGAGASSQVGNGRNVGARSTSRSTGSAKVSSGSGPGVKVGNGRVGGSRSGR